LAGAEGKKIVMTLNAIPRSKPRRIAAVAAALAIAGLLSGCVVYPAGGYYGGGHHHYWHRY
jgi:hypothetical protein